MKALVLSGGGSKGPFHVGAIRRLVGERRIHYPIICGVSVGALVGGFLAMYPEGDEVRAAADLDELFLGIKNRDVWKHWPVFRRVSGLWKPGFLNTAPLQKLVVDRLDPERIKASGKRLRVGAVSLTTGRYQTFTEDHDDIAQALLASSSFPGFFPPIKMGDHLWTDGGIQQVTPIQAALQAGATEIDVIVTSPEGAYSNFEEKPEALDVLLRSVNLMVHRLTWIDVRHAETVNRLVAAGLAPTKRMVKIRVMSPDSNLNGDSLHFDPDEAREISLRGYKKAQIWEPDD